MKTLLLLVLSLVTAAPALYAHGDHKHEEAVEAPPHGGILRDATPFKSEIVVEGENVTLYLYDKDLKPVALDAPAFKGDVQFPRQKKAKPVTFKREGDVYKARIPGIGKVHRYDLHVTVEAGGKKALADFGIDNIH